MGIKIEEVFEIQAQPDRVWAYLTDPRQVVNCLPGAELTSVQDDVTFLGRVKVKVGPIVAAYAGKVVLTERDDANRIVRMTGEGRESGGSGSAKMTMTSTVTALASGASEVRVSAEIDIVGRIAQFGRGMIENVNKQMFKQFTDCVRNTLTAAPVASAAPATTTPPPAAQSTDLESQAAPPVASDVAPSVTAPPIATQQISVQPVSIVPVVLRALRDYLLGLLARVVGRKPRGTP